MIETLSGFLTPKQKSVRLIMEICFVLTNQCLQFYVDIHLNSACQILKPVQIAYIMECNLRII